MTEQPIPSGLSNPEPLNFNDSRRVPEGFTRHDGGPCPVGADVLTLAVYRPKSPMGEVFGKAIKLAKLRAWGRIIAYKVVIPAPAEPIPDAEGGDILEALQDTCCEARNTYQGNEHGGPDPDEHWAKVIQRALPGRYLHALANPALRPSPPAPEGCGWLFWNPDTGEEWASDHPIESGEVPDAQNIRSATASVMVAAYTDRCVELAERAVSNAAAWERARIAEAARPSAPSLEEVKGALEQLARTLDADADLDAEDKRVEGNSRDFHQGREAGLTRAATDIRALLTRIGDSHGG